MWLPAWRARPWPTPRLGPRLKACVRPGKASGFCADVEAQAVAGSPLGAPSVGRPCSRGAYVGTGKGAGCELCSLCSDEKTAEGRGMRGGCRPGCLDGEAGGVPPAPRACFHQGSHGKRVWELVAQVVWLLTRSRRAASPGEREQGPGLGLYLPLWPARGPSASPRLPQPAARPSRPWLPEAGGERQAVPQMAAC